MRPLARPYLQHGSRHGRTGSDPIPGIGQVPFAALHNDASSGTTITNTGMPQYISMQDGSSGALFETSDATVFENAQGSGLSGDPWGIKCLLDGTYLIWENYFVGGGTAGAIFATYHTIGGGGNTVSFWQPGRTSSVVGDTWDRGSGALVHTFFSELADATEANPAPFWINPYASLQSGTDITVKVQTFVQYLGLYAGGNI